MPSRNCLSDATVQATMCIKSWFFFSRIWHYYFWWRCREKMLTFLFRCRKSEKPVLLRCIWSITLFYNTVIWNVSKSWQSRGSRFSRPGFPVAARQLVWIRGHEVFAGAANFALFSFRLNRMHPIFRNIFFGQSRISQKSYMPFSDFLPKNFWERLLKELLERRLFVPKSWLTPSVWNK